MKGSISLIAILSVLNTINAYSYSKEAVYLLGDNCFGKSETSDHEYVSDTINPENPN
jgi:hypothetical protein